MKITLQRTTPPAESVEKGRTFGRLTVEGMCLTLEDPTREVPGEPVESWKIPEQTAIPSGTYKVALQKSPKFGTDTITLLDVPGYTDIRVHGGNTAADTEGCPLVGFIVKDDSILGGASKPALDVLKASIKFALMRGEEVTFEIVPAEEARAAGFVPAGAGGFLREAGAMDVRQSGLWAVLLGILSKLFKLKGGAR